MHLAVKSGNITLALHAIVWGIILSVPLLVPNPYNNAFPVTFDVLVGFIHLALFYFNAFFLYPKLLTGKRWWLYVVAIILVVLGAFQIKYLILKFGFPQTPWTDDKNGLLGFPILLTLVASIIFRVALDHIRQEKLLKELEAQQLTSELKFLRSQISPHFLFNVLNNLVSMARYKSDQLEPSLIRLAELMRYMLYESDARKVSLRKEIDYLNSYIALQKLRFGEDVEISSVIECKNKDLMVEPMLLIPFVENAFKHGVVPVKDPFIHIALKSERQALLLTVKNKSGTDTEHSKDRDSGIGLANVRSRLKLLYPGRHALTISDRNGIFEIRLKLSMP